MTGIKTSGNFLRKACTMRFKSSPARMPKHAATHHFQYGMIRVVSPVIELLRKSLGKTKLLVSLSKDEQASTCGNIFIDRLHRNEYIGQKKSKVTCLTSCQFILSLQASKEVLMKQLLRRSLKLKNSRIHEKSGMTCRLILEGQLPPK